MRGAPRAPRTRVWCGHMGESTLSSAHHAVCACTRACSHAPPRHARTRTAAPRNRTPPRACSRGASAHSSSYFGEPPVSCSQSWAVSHSCPAGWRPAGDVSHVCLCASHAPRSGDPWEGHSCHGVITKPCSCPTRWRLVGWPVMPRVVRRPVALASRFYIYAPIQSNRRAVRVGASRRRPIASGVYLSDKRPRHRPRGAIGYLPR